MFPLKPDAASIDRGPHFSGFYSFYYFLSVLSRVFVSLKCTKNVSFVCFSSPLGLASLWREPLAMLRFGE